MSGINHMANTDSPQQRRTAVGLSPDTLMVLNHVDGSFRDFHFLPNAWVPNQKAIMEDRINISSSENTSAIAAANGTPVL